MTELEPESRDGRAIAEAERKSLAAIEAEETARLERAEKNVRVVHEEDIFPRLSTVKPRWSIGGSSKGGSR